MGSTHETEKIARLARQDAGSQRYKVGMDMPRFTVVVPCTLAIIFLLLYLTFRRIDEALLILLAVPFALTGGFWLIWSLGHAISVASAVGFIALAGGAAEFGVVMPGYLKGSWERLLTEGRMPSEALRIEAITEGAVYPREQWRPSPAGLGLR